MPYEITREPQGLYKRFWGVVTAKEFLESVSKFHNDPFFEKIRYSINDFSDTERFELDEDGIWDTAAVNLGANAFNTNYRILAITVDPVIVGMAKKYDAITGLKPILIFPTQADARHWIQPPT